jgi:hypothetical protein
MKTETLSLTTKRQNPETAFVAKTTNGKKTWLESSLQSLCEALMESGHDEEEEPVLIQLADGRSLSYHMVLAHYCYAEGSITEEKFITDSINRLD